MRRLDFAGNRLVRGGGTLVAYSSAGIQPMRRNQSIDHSNYGDGLLDSLSCSTRYLRESRSGETADLRHFENGASIVIEGDQPRGAYLIRVGRIKITACTPEGRVLILGVAVKGDTLGLSAVLTRCDYEASA